MSAVVAAMAAGLLVLCVGAARSTGAAGPGPEARAGSAPPTAADGPVPPPPTGAGPLADQRPTSDIGPRGAWARALRSAGIAGDPSRWLRVGSGAVLGAGGLALLRGGPAGATAVTVVSAGAVALGLRAARGRGDRQADAQIPDLLEHVARELRSGLDLPRSLESAGRTVGGPHGAELGAAVTRVARGAPLVDALRPWADRHPRAPVRLSLAALEVASEAGGARARALDGIAATLRSRAVVADEARALASQARASAAVMVALPVVVAAVGGAADPRLARTLLGTPVGLTCVVTAALLDGAGAWWMQRVVDGAHQ